jgi:hypothetical protein
VTGRACAWALAAIGATGCATEPVRPIEIPLLELTLSSRWPAADSRPLATIESVTREGASSHDRDMGVAAIGHRNARAQIRSAVPIEQQVGSAVERALLAHGVWASQPEHATYRLALVIDRFAVHEYATGSSPEHSRAVAQYDVLVRDAIGTLLFAQEIEARVVTESSWTDTTKANEPAIRQAMRESLEALFSNAEFIALFAPVQAPTPSMVPADSTPSAISPGGDPATTASPDANAAVDAAVPEDDRGPAGARDSRR